ncbi:MAG: IS1634 family transposase [Cytophagaceae bacterium]|nr:IS1634 family transposase [Cytophagaceae bacterium]
MRKTIDKKSGKTYLALARAYRDKETKKSQVELVESLGNLDELKKIYPDPIAHFKSIAEQRTLLEKAQKENIMITANPREQLTPGDNRKNFGYAVISKIYHEMGLDVFFSNHMRGTKVLYNLNAIMKMLVYSRILCPSSKKKTFERRGMYFDKMDFSLDDVYRSLTMIGNFIDGIQLWIHRHIQDNRRRNTDFIFYDVTNYYFEIDEQDELRRKGVSKEHRPDPIVQMGLFVDNDGLPITYHLYPGNCNDCLTLIPLMKTIRQKYELGKAVVVADKGLNTDKNAYYLANHRGGYIFSQKVRGGSNELKKYVLDPSGYRSYGTAHQHDGDDQQKGNKIKSRQFTRVVEFLDDDGTIIKAEIAEKQIVFYSSKYDIREKKLRAATIEKAKDLINNPSKYNRNNAYGAAKYISNIKYDKKTGEILTPAELLKFNQEKLDEEEKFDGYYLITTSRYNEPDDWAVNHYRELWQIEETFRITKSDLETRPIYVSRKDHIESHFAICFIALVIIRIIQFRMAREYSPAMIAESLGNIGCTDIGKNYYVFDHRDTVTDTIAKTFDIDFSRKYMSLGEIRKAIGSTKRH